MIDNFLGDWAGRKQRFESWWKRENSDRPLLVIQAPLRRGGGGPDTDRWAKSSSGEASVHMSEENAPGDYATYWTQFDTMLSRHMATFERSCYAAETYPRLFANLGVASLAAFLGGHPVFAKDTIWYEHVFKDVVNTELVMDRRNPWLQWSLEFTRYATERSQGRYLVGIPDIVENLDVLGCLFESEQVMFDVMDYPQDIHRLLREIQDAWREAYDLHRALCTDAEGYCNFGPFQLLGKGKVAKLQCDMSAMISVSMFEEFVLPCLEEQVGYVDKSLYHLDGVDASRHLDLVLSLDKLTALQWTPGAGKPDGGDDCWDFIYRKALDAGKSIYALVAPQNVERFIRKFGSKGLLILTQAEDRESAEDLVRMAERVVRTSKGAQ